MRNLIKVLIFIIFNTMLFRRSLSALTGYFYSNIVNKNFLRVMFALAAVFALLFIMIKFSLPEERW
jgi:hypothetical protein